MKIQFLILILTLALAMPVIAEQPKIEIYTDKNTYLSGERGIITAEIETFGVIHEAEIEMEILGPSGKFVYGDLLYIQIPKKTILNPNTMQTEQVLYHEDIDYLDAGKTIRRNINFEVPINAVEGIYTVIVRLASPYITLEGSKYLYISGGGEVIDIIIIIYIVILILSLYLIWRG